MDFKKHAPLILIIVAFCVQYGIFWRPEQGMAYVQDYAVSKIEFKLLQDQINLIASDVRDIKNHLINKK